MTTRTKILLLLALVIVIDVVALIVAAPFDPKATDGSCAYPLCFINGNLEFPAPNVVAAVGEPVQLAGELVIWQVSISSTIVTMWIVSIFTILLLFFMTRGQAMVPGKVQNAMEYVWEQIEGFGMSLGGPEARPFILVFVGFFLYILLSNWSGLVPPIGKVEFLRAPTSDVNITIGLAIVAFIYFEYQGFHRLGVRGYLGKFFPFGSFRQGIGTGVISMFVGVLEFFLEFIKPVTLAMRLFGNIYGGEVALGVMTALTIAIVPMALIALELLLNLVQALIFSTLTLMFAVIAVESHAEDHHEGPYEPDPATLGAEAARAVSAH